MNLPIGFRNLLKNSAKEIRQTSAKSQIPAIRRLQTAEFVEDSLSIRKQAIEVPAERLFTRLSSTHLIAISAIEYPLKRAFYEIEAINGCWSVKELDRQIGSSYYERSGLHANGLKAVHN